MQYLTIDRNSATVRNVLTSALHPEPANRLISVTREDEIFGKNYKIVVVVVVGDPINMLTVEAPGHRDVLVVLVLISFLFVA